MKRVYIATSRSNAAAARRFASSVRSLGHRVNSRWHERDDALLGMDESKMEQLARHDIAEQCKRDIVDSNVYILLAHKDCRGALWEHGYAYALGLKVFVVGDRNELSAMVEQRDADFFEEEREMLAWLKKQT